MPDHASCPAPRLRCARRDDVQTWTLSLDQMLTPDHPARTAWAFASRLDLTPLYAAIRAVEGHPGRPHIDPRLLFALWLLVTMRGFAAVGPRRRAPARVAPVSPPGVHMPGGSSAPILVAGQLELVNWWRVGGDSVKGDVAIVAP